MSEQSENTQDPFNEESITNRSESIDELDLLDELDPSLKALVEQIEEGLGISASDRKLTKKESELIYDIVVSIHKQQWMDEIQPNDISESETNENTRKIELHHVDELNKNIEDQKLEKIKIIESQKAIEEEQEILDIDNIIAVMLGEKEPSNEEIKLKTKEAGVALSQDLIELMRENDNFLGLSILLGNAQEERRDVAKQNSPSKNSDAINSKVILNDLNKSNPIEEQKNLESKENDKSEPPKNETITNSKRKP